MGMRTGIDFTVSASDRLRLEAVLSARSSPQKHVWRARIILLSGDGIGTSAILAATGKSKTCVWRWQERFMVAGVAGLLHETETRARHRAVGLAASTVQGIWQAHGLAPHRWRQFKLSNDKAFAEKLHDVVGLYLAPPAHAVVLSIDEPSQMQALDRTQPGLPLKKGRGPTMTHDYKRHGTTTLFAALNVLTGTVIGQNAARHRHQEFLRFLNQIERDVPLDKAIHVILDNYCTHKHANVREWLARHPRWTFHFIPTSSSWLNAVEGFFAKLTRRRLKHGVFRSVDDLKTATDRFIELHNEGEAKPFKWRANPDEIIAARNRGFQLLESIH